MRSLTDRARKHPDQLFMLVVDEIDCGNLSKIFAGVVLPARIREEAIDLMYSSGHAGPFMLPRNVFIIVRVEYRRPLDCPRGHGDAPPLPGSFRCTRRGSRRNLLLRRWLTVRKYPRVSRTCTWRAALRSTIGVHLFGPSYFMRPVVHSEGGLAQVVRHRDHFRCSRNFTSVTAPWIAMPGTALLLWRRAWPPVNDPVTLTLFERAPCGYGCPSCLVCRPQVALTPEGAAAFAATGLVTVSHDCVRGVHTDRHRRMSGLSPSMRSLRGWNRNRRLVVIFDDGICQ